MDIIVPFPGCGVGTVAVVHARFIASAAMYRIPMIRNYSRAVSLGQCHAAGGDVYNGIETVGSDGR
ncbi:hypothetical protein NEOLEDRAFT_1135225 [Neolentinus lepideus HHB14362 ss-1]|uniref:Uncharacterized protein n=1 Tax=Neolentinus lepideus HHB14362 ss-1 TaxID=1314782 RepID=A0A165RXC5_9AGAM|nr:hypothetical protein NEOLEDRAFT_1135225 [Neolentinus lepideus HHB14362 ss-1]